MIDWTEAYVPAASIRHRRKREYTQKENPNQNERIVDHSENRLPN
jgi:hypothetical protein